MQNRNWSHRLFTGFLYFTGAIGVISLFSNGFNGVFMGLLILSLAIYLGYLRGTVEAITVASEELVRTRKAFIRATARNDELLAEIAHLHREPQADNLETLSQDISPIAG